MEEEGREGEEERETRGRSENDWVCATIRTTLEFFFAQPSFPCPLRSSPSQLPAELGNLNKLKTLKMNQNEIKLMPDSMEFCTSLTELQLTGNYIDRFPDFINKLSNVKRIMLGNNFLKILPYTLGFLKGLVDLQLFNNPLL